MTRRSLIRSIVASVVLAAPAMASGGQGASARDIEEGKAIFAGACVVCHGIAGGGAMAPPLNRPTLQSAPDDATLQRVIKEGMPERGMPGGDGASGWPDAHYWIQRAESKARCGCRHPFCSEWDTTRVSRTVELTAAGRD